MGWQEEELKKRFEEKYSEDAARKYILSYWRKFQDANESLLPDLRFKDVFTNAVPGSTMRLLGPSTPLGYTSHIYCLIPLIIHDIIQIDIYNKIGRLFIVLYPKEESVPYALVEGDSANLYFKIDDLSYEIILKNLCLNNYHPSYGLTQLKKDPRINESKLISIFAKLFS